MIDDKTMRSMLEGMESAAEEALRGDAAFYDTLRTLKAEIESDPQVQSAISELHAAGSRVYSSLVPRVKVRVRTTNGEIALAEQNNTACDASSTVAQLTQELRSAAHTVLMRGRYREMLDNIMNQAVQSSDRFERIAAQLEGNGNEIVICLDLSACARIREAPKANRRATGLQASMGPLAVLLSKNDHKFLKDLKISLTEK